LNRRASESVTNVQFKNTLVRVGLVALALAVPATAAADPTGPFEKGPDPTTASLLANNGTFGFTKTVIPDSVTPGFGAATIWAPRVTTPGETFGAIAVVPGWTENEGAITWVGQRLVQRGFVLITFNTNNVLELPGPRAQELQAALKWLVNSSPAKGEIDPSRLGVIGHSMGGGAALDVVRGDPTIKADVALSPWEQSAAYTTVSVPTLIFGADQDIVAPIVLHATPFYNAIPKTTPKEYIVLKNANHFTVTAGTPTVSANTIAWMKLFLDNDTRYTPFLGQTLTATAGSVSTHTSTYPTFPGN
jgi:dienelactone hydrolase